MDVLPRPSRWILGTAVVLSLLAGCGSQNPPTADPAPRTSTGAADTGSFDSLVHRLRAQAEEAASSGGVLVYVRQGKDSTVIAQGLADERSQRAMRPDDTVMIASLTKAWVAAATMSLVADGTLSLEDTVEKWLPGLLPKPDVTVEQLMAMTAGLASYDTSADYPGSGRLPARRLVDLAKALPGFRLFDPGTRAEESNTNAVLLGMVVERAAGASVPDVVRERVFDKLGLHHSAFGGTPTAHGYVLGQDQTVVDPRFPSIASGGVASVGDVAAFLDGLLDGRVVPADQVREMTTSRGTDGVDDFGLGLRTPHDGPCDGVWGQKGGNAAFASRAWNNRELDRTVVAVMSPGSQEDLLDTVAMDAVCG